ncbi:hypothetical protein BV25DRAFT_1805486 [Artomyces pyxidatus]|uniref:Uncharacterized protein n=1 Tax=Artomyces pyxidatus TaxID=48021 RepID=A0ACB8SZ38_9AGAM|nr:hypothetical protein BV25DRAFT_1805486 [Artomyces pyxidatus]
MSTTARCYGESLPDQVDRVARLADAQSEVVGDIRDLYRDRANLEREYATKMQALAQKAVEKKNKRMSPAVVGDEPSKAWNEETLTRSTFESLYSKIIASMVNSAQEHTNLCNSLNTQVVGVSCRPSQQTQFYQRLLSDRDRVYNDRLLTQMQYDEECEEVETYRQKQGRAHDDKHADRAARQYQQQQADMYNAKNIYLIATTVANKVKDRFYAEDLPSLENSLSSAEKLQTHLLSGLVLTLHQAHNLQLAHHEALKAQASMVDAAANELDTNKDQDLFIEYNLRPFSAPNDWVFEPCATHYDTGELNAEGAPKVVLQNKLSRSRSKLTELRPLLENKRKEADQLTKIVTAYLENPSLGNVDDIIDNFLDTQHQATLFDNSLTIVDTEVQTIEAALDGDVGSQSPHAFKSSSFTIPTECGYCGTSIWGLSKQGKSCKLCGLAVHSKCELKVAADCTGVRGSRHRSTDSLSRASSRPFDAGPASSVTALPAAASSTPTPSSFAQSDLHSHTEEPQAARVVFDFTPTSPFELAVHEGDTVRIVEEDDGSGWVKVSDNRGGKGLVPASYIDYTGAEASSSSSQALSGVQAPRGRHPEGSGKYVRALFEYKSQGPDELDVTDGETIELTNGAAGGQNYAEGWWEGIDASGRKGIFPSNYVSTTEIATLSGSTG